MTDAGILIRVSTARQGAEGVSTETQRADCLAYAERMGWTVAQIEEDHATGTNFDRAGYRKLADAAQRGEIQVIVVYSLDRFGRDQLGARIALQELAKSGAELHTVAGVVKDDLLFTIISRVSEFQSEQTSEKVTRNMAQRAATGHWQAPPPFGYDIGPCPDKCGKRLVPNADDHIVTEMARRFDAGASYSDIHAWLRAEHGLVKDAEWPRRTLQNPAYAGDVYFGRRGDGTFVSKGKRRAGDVIVTRNAHHALIEPEVFDRIQTRFKTCGFTRGKPRALDGLVYCGCGAKCYPVPGGRKGSYIYRYVCSLRQRFGTCPEQPVAYSAVADALDAELDRLPHLITDHRDIRHRLLALVEPDIKRLLAGSDTVRKKLEADIEKLERQHAQVYADRLEDPAAVPLKAVADIAERIKGAKAELKSLKHTMSDFELDETIIGMKAEALQPMERELTRLLVERIVVQAGTVTVVWNEYGKSLVNKVDGQPLARHLGQTKPLLRSPARLAVGFGGKESASSPAATFTPSNLGPPLPRYIGELGAVFCCSSLPHYSNAPIRPEVTNSAASLPGKKPFAVTLLRQDQMPRANTLNMDCHDQRQ